MTTLARFRGLSRRGASFLASGIVAVLWMGCEAESRIARQGAEPGACRLDKDVLDFGSAVIATGVGRDTVHVRNVGDGPLDGRIALASQHFRIEDGAGRFHLEPGGEHEFVVAFEPVEPGSLEFVLDLGTGCRSVSGFGIGLRPAACELTGLDGGGFLDFGSVAIESQGSGAREVLLENTGDAPLEVDVRLEGDGCAAFELTGGGTFVLEGGRSRAFTVRFDPAETRSYNCELVFGSEACGSVLLLGRGILGAICEVQAETIDFGTVALGDRTTRSVTVHNAGDVALSGTALLAGSCEGLSFETNGGPFTLLPEQSRTLRLAFAPTTSGSRACQLELGTSCSIVALLAAGDDGAVCQATRSSIDFGDLDTNVERLESVTITNAGGSVLDLDVELAAPAGTFSIRRGGGVQRLLRNESVQVDIAFESSTEGLFEAELLLGSASCTSIPLSGRATSPALCVVPDEDLDLGRILVGETTVGTFTLRNDGGRTLAGQIAFDGACTGFSLLSAASYEIAARSALEFEVQFAPQSVGEFSCTIDTGGDCPPVVVRAEAEPLPACELSVEALEFGTVTIGSETTRTFTVRNSGGGRLTGTATVNGAGFTLERAFIQTGASRSESMRGGIAFDLGAGEALELIATFRPTSEGIATGTVELGTALCDPVSLSGTGRPPADCIVSTTLLDFGTLVAGNQAERSFEITNNGGAELTGVVALTGCSNEFAILEGAGPYALASQERLTVRLAYTPTGAGDDECAVDSGLDCDPVVIRGAGLDPPMCSIVPPALDFGTVVVGQSSAWIPFVVRNTGGSPLSIDLSLGDGCSDVSLDGGGVHIIAAGDSAEAQVRWAPSSALDLACVIETNSICGTFPLTGSAEPAALCAVDASSLVFGPIVEGETESKNVTIRNNGGYLLSGNVTLSGCGSEYAILAGGGPFSLSANQTRVVTVEFRPGAEGSYSCELDLGTQCDPVSLSGTAQNPPTCEVTPTLLDFGSLAPGETSVDSFLVRNTGGGELVIAATLGNCEDFVLASDGTFSLGALEQRWIRVEFSPNDSEESECQVSLAGGCDAVSVVGIAEEPPQCAVSVDAVDFGTVTATGSNYTERTFELENVGGGTLTGTILESCSAFHLLNGSGTQVSSLPFSLGAGETMVVETRFRPTALGNQSCSFVIQADAGDGCVVSASGRGAASYALHIAGRIAGCGQGAGHQHETSFLNYSDVIARVDSGNPLCSQLLRKPAEMPSCVDGTLHGGALIDGWQWNTGSDHILVRNWIQDGAAP